jgi:hypothetical protein
MSDLLPSCQVRRRPLYVVDPSRRSFPARTRVVIDWLIKVLSEKPQSKLSGGDLRRNQPARSTRRPVCTVAEVAMRTQATALYPFVPSGPDYRLALTFFAELGFETAWEHDGYAGLRWGGAYFILQSIDAPEWQKNQMLAIEVDSLDDFWAEIAFKDLPARFTGVRCRPPTDFPWGREVHIVDPGGVCWHVRQASIQGTLRV